MRGLKKNRFSWSGKVLAVVLALILCLPLLWAPVPAEASVPDGVYAFGSSQFGQLGLGDRISFSRTPSKIEGLENPKDVAAGDVHSLILLHNGYVYSFGDTNNGRLGHGEMEDRYINAPIKIEGIGRAKAIGVGRYNSFIILENGDLYSFGRNSLGALGVGDYDNRLVPTRVEGISNAVAVDSGQSHTLVLLENGDVYGFGATNYTLGIWPKKGDTGSTFNTPQRVPLPGPARNIAAGSIHSLVLLENGDVYSFGNGLRGQLGHPERKNVRNPTKIEGLGPAKAVAAGSDYSMVLLENGDLYSFGYNSTGQLGLGDRENRNQPTRVEALSGVSMIASGYRHTLVVLENGDLYTFGEAGSSGRLGHGNQEIKTTPTLVETLAGSNALAVAGGFHHSLVVVGTPPITIEIDGQLLVTDVPPIILQGRTMVPLRAIFEALNVEVVYDAATRTITGTTDEISIQLTVDSTSATVNGEEVTLDVPAIVIDGRTLVPVRFIAESTGAEVEWEARTRRVLITTK